MRNSWWKSQLPGTTFFSPAATNHCLITLFTGFLLLLLGSTTHNYQENSVLLLLFLYMWAIFLLEKCIRTLSLTRNRSQTPTSFSFSVDSSLSEDLPISQLALSTTSNLSSLLCLRDVLSEDFTIYSPWIKTFAGSSVRGRKICLTLFFERWYTLPQVWWPWR